MADDDDTVLIRADNLDRLICERSTTNKEFSVVIGMNNGTLGTARRGEQFSDKTRDKIIAGLDLPEDYFDIDRRTGDKPEKKQKRGTPATKMTSVRFEGDSFNVTVEVTEKKAREMIMGLLHS